MKKYILFLFCVSAYFGICKADTGVLIPGDEQEPNPAILALEEMKVEISIDHQHARVRIRQIFANRTKSNQEGKYVFAIPGDAAISDFAVWDGVIRIPGVILERKRASEIYEQLRLQEIDPGLLQQEEGAEGPRMAGVFSARIVPIPPLGTKRLELEYRQRVSVEGMQSYFSLPLKPDLYRSQQVKHFSISVEVISQSPMEDFKLISKMYPIQFQQDGPQKLRGTFETQNITLAEDFALKFRLAEPRSDLSFLAYRKSNKSAGSAEIRAEDGYFWSSALLNEGKKQTEIMPGSFLILLDTSSSMRWEKLDQAYRSLQYFLERLQEQDEFQLMLFHQEVQAHSPSPVAANAVNKNAALGFIRSQFLMGGTDFEKAFQQAFSAASSLKNQEKYLILITDGNPTLTQLQTAKILKLFEEKMAATPLRAFCFGIGSDSNRTLLSQLSEKSNGHFDWVRENEDLDFKLQAFFAKVGQFPVSNLVLKSSEPDLIYNVYPSDPARVYDGSAFEWFGRYRKHVTAELLVQGKWQTDPIELKHQVQFPEEATEHDFIPRGWARRRVDALLQQIEFEGESDALIDEIIALSKKYKFVTPYTSFLAAPRSLLRPRVIRPGDPILRIKTDPEIVSVIAIFPFGFVKRLEYLESEEIWQTRFLVPKEAKDGNYFCRVILRDRQGNQYEEMKSFLVDSKPPMLRTRWEGSFTRGARVKLLVSADQDTRWLLARLDMEQPVPVRWNSRERASVGYVAVPADLKPGVYELQIIAEDFAHNHTRQTHKIEVH